MRWRSLVETDRFQGADFIDHQSRDKHEDCAD